MTQDLRPQARARLPHHLGLAAAGLLAAASAWSQTPPDAGRLLQQERLAPQLPATPPPAIGLPAASATTPAGGASLRLQGLRFSGNSVYSADQLLAVLGPLGDQPYDMAGLQALADRISAFYRAQGYPFARALLPAQRFADGMLEISVLEGRYGQVTATGNARLAPQAQAFLAPLRPGNTIAAAPLERATLLLSDQPGIQIRPLVRPGQAVGSGDLEVEVSAGPTWRGELGLDNHGNRYTGSHRASASLVGDSPWRLGDQLTLKALVSEDRQWLGQASYSLPLGSGGWRGQASLSRTSYELGKQFAGLQASGTADTAALGLTYAWLRARQSNVSLQLLPQHKRLKDDQAATGSRSRKTSQVLAVLLQADHRDDLAGGGVSYGSLGWTTGRLSLGQPQRAADAASARSQGSFQKLNLDIARHQRTAVPGLTLYGRLSAQWANRNLDSSEDFGLGGASGVRAYPSGEGFGDQGALLQLEARYAIGAWAPFVFVDHGRIRANHRPWAAGANHRELGGGGLGLRLQHGPWTLESSLAWAGQGGAATSDTKRQTPRLWAQAAWRF